MTINVPLDPEPAGLPIFDKPVGEVGRELIVLELYRQGRISSGKPAELRSMPRVAFSQLASALPT